MHQFPNLTNVNISHNYLSNFPSFGSNTKPEIIDLSFNSITYLNDKELEIIDYMKPSKIYLDGNPLLIIRTRYSKTRLYLTYTTVNIIHMVITEERVTENGNQNFDKHSLSNKSPDANMMRMFPTAMTI
jgi:hypothetical protein